MDTSKQVKTIIIEDETFALEDLLEMLKNHPEIDVIGEAGSVGGARKLLKDRDPDLVFLDIQLRGGSGFDLVGDIPVSSKIIFFTSYDHYAVRAFEINALDYLLKPVTEERLNSAIKRVLENKRRNESTSLRDQHVSDLDQIYIRSDRDRRFVHVNDVVAVTSMGGNYTAVHLEGGYSPLVRKTLKEWEKLLPKPLFFRLHRSTIVNTSYLNRVEKGPDKSYKAFFSGMDKSVEIPRRNVAHMKRLMEKMVEM